MKRLFESGIGVFHESKQEAKEYADAHNARPVRLGPDHWRYGLKSNPRTHSHNAKSGGHGNGFPNKRRK